MVAGKGLGVLEMSEVQGEVGITERAIKSCALCGKAVGWSARGPEGVPHRTHDITAT